MRGVCVVTAGVLFLAAAGVFVVASLLLCKNGEPNSAARTVVGMALTLAVYLSGATAVLCGFALVIRFLLSLA
jgi:hypothetical protein